MSLQTVSVTVCLFLAHIAADTGVHFVMERHPDSYFCGHLQCVADLTKSDNEVASCVELTIYDITQVNSELKLASVSAFHPDVYVDTTKRSAVSCTGIISRLQTNLTLKLRHDIDCLYGVYKCQLDLITESGHPEVLTEIVIPEYNYNYTTVAEVISHIDKLTGLFNIQTILMSNQTTVINKLGSQLADVTSQLMNQTAAIDKLGNHADNQITKLRDQTAEINKQGRQLDILTTGLTNHTSDIHKLESHVGHQAIKLIDQTTEINTLGRQLGILTSGLMNYTYIINKLESHLELQTIQMTSQTAAINTLGSRVDHQTTKLVNQTEEISKQGSRLDNQTTKLTEQTAEINKLGSLVDQQTTKLMNDLTAQLINQTAQLHNISQRLDLETTKQKQQHDASEKRLTALDLNLDTIQKLSDQVADTIQDQRRTNGDVNFFRGWEAYKIGFGNLNTGFWLGNNAIHLLAEQGYNELRIELLYEGRRTYAHYSNFNVASETMDYKLTIGAFEGTAGDSLTKHNNMYFSTFDRENDKHDTRNCADVRKGAWWYYGSGCETSNLNGLWGEHGGWTEMTWEILTGSKYVSFSEMKVRRG